LGVAVVRVQAGGAGARAGLRGVREGGRGTVIPGDVIVAVNGKNVDGQARLLAYLDDYKPGTVVGLTVWREGKQIEVPVTLQTGDAEG
jgi:S1-C subfamily serine protease